MDRLKLSKDKDWGLGFRFDGERIAGIDVIADRGNLARLELTVFDS